jgi:phage terminase large subunit-like protein
MQTLIDVDRRLCDPAYNPEAYWDFVQAAWPHTGDPSTFVPTQVARTMCAALTDTVQRKSPDLLINLPPGQSKSMLCSVLFPAWVWSWDPAHRFLCLTYDRDLSYRDAGKCRALIESEWYQTRWAVDFVTGNNVKGKYVTSAGGSRRSTTLRSGIMGNHANTVIVDDPQSASKIGLSDIDEMAAESAWARHIWDTVLPTRVAGDIHKSRRIVVMQRLSELDLSQHILESGQELRHIMLPMWYDPDRACADDWRTTEGELLAPERLDAAAVDKLTSRMSASSVAAQIQQDPTAQGAGLFASETWPRYTDLPEHGIVGISIDGATAGRARGEAARAAESRSRWALTAWLRSGGNHYLLDVDAFREDFDVVLDRIEAFAQRVAASVKRGWTLDDLVVERKSTGEAAVSMLRSRELGGFVLTLWDVGTSKVERASACLPVTRAGRVQLPAQLDTAQVGAWALTREELAKFPRGKSDDIVDTLSQMVLYWQNKFGEDDDFSLDNIQAFGEALLGG